MIQDATAYSGSKTDTISSLAQQAAKQLGWNSTFVANQWALETGHFTSGPWKTDNNPAGIKWYPGMTFGTKGSAASDGGYYAHFSDPVTGYVQFVKNNPRYSNVANSQDPYTEAQTVQRDGWATDPAYASKVMAMKVNGNQTVNFNSDSSFSGSGSSSSTNIFGLPDIPGLVSKALGVIVGAGIVFLGIWAAMNPLSDLTTAITSTVRQFSKMPFEGATKAVRNAPNSARKRMNETPEEKKQRNENKKIDKQIKQLGKDAERMG